MPATLAAAQILQDTIGIIRSPPVGQVGPATANSASPGVSNPSGLACMKSTIGWAPLCSKRCATSTSTRAVAAGGAGPASARQRPGHRGRRPPAPEAHRTTRRSTRHRPRNPRARNSPQATSRCRRGRAGRRWSRRPAALAQQRGGGTPRVPRIPTPVQERDGDLPPPVRHIRCQAEPVLRFSHSTTPTYSEL